VDSLNAFSERNGIPENARVAIFLTDDGRAPETGPRSAVATIIMRNMSRTELFDLFRAGLRKSPAKSPLLMQLLDNYLREIKRLV